MTEWTKVGEVTRDDIGAGDIRNDWNGRLFRFDWLGGLVGVGWRGWIFGVDDGKLKIVFVDSAVDNWLVWGVIGDGWRSNGETVTRIELFDMRAGSLGTIFVDIVNGNTVRGRCGINWIWRCYWWYFRIVDHVIEVGIYDGTSDEIEVGLVAVDEWRRYFK